ncbi:MAG TPA: DUF1420 family protein [Candidatus Eisenbacteria bacterium]|jgi:hypothetical protein|nr:DUF1420 family protein [Candidatus Eisenbacteria bacterium]
MILLGSLATAVALLVFSALLAGAGNRALRWLHLEIPSALESLLYSLGLGTIFLELAVSVGQLFAPVRVGVISAACVTAAIGITGQFQLLRDLSSVWHRFRALSRLERFLGFVLFGVLALQGLASFAPVTGSDALHYHFTIEALYLRQGFHVEWALLHGFFCALGHQLILTGLAFGSDKLACGLIFVGGAAAVLATIRLARQWTSGAWPFVVALVFALTPVTFWQISAAGAPDIWMCALLPLGVLAILLAQRAQSAPACILAGILAGALAGAKYTGIMMAGALLLAFAAELRSVRKCLIFFGSAIAVGIWPYLRNWIWTGDPVFPFFFARHHNLAGNLVALQSLLKDTGASNPHSFGRTVRFPIFAIADSDGLATWQFLGPLVLALAPIVLLRLRNTPLWRVAMIVWLMVSLAVGVTSGIPRFLLPVLPLALSANLGAVALFTQGRFRLLRAVTVLSVAGFCLAGFVALVMYSRPAWSAALGRVSQESYLRIHAPDFERSEFINSYMESLPVHDTSARALVFFRHLYYLRVPFVAGDPNDSWETSPTGLASNQQWLDFFSRRHIRWVVKAPVYPDELAAALTRLEGDGILRPCATGTVQSIQGFRINGQFVSEPIAILCVNP